MKPFRILRIIRAWINREFVPEEIHSRRISFGVELLFGLYAIWFLVGVVLVSFDFPVIWPGWSDFLFIFLAFLFVGLNMIRQWGVRHTFPILGLVLLLSGLAEYLGAELGWFFGDYEYTDQFGPQIVGVLPIAIPMAWVIILIPLWSWSRHQLRGLSPSWLRGGVVVLLSATLAVAVDLFIEPLAVEIRGYWHWEGSGPWYGVPTSNFMGWFLISILILVVIQSISSKRKALPLSSGGMIMFLSVILFFVCTLLGQGYGKPVLLGLGIMGLMSLYWRGGRRDEG